MRRVCKLELLPVGCVLLGIPVSREIRDCRGLGDRKSNVDVCVVSCKEDRGSWRV